MLGGVKGYLGVCRAKCVSVEFLRVEQASVWGRGRFILGSVDGEVMRDTAGIGVGWGRAGWAPILKFVLFRS